MLYTFDTACYKLCFQLFGGQNTRMGVFGRGVDRICAVVAASTAREARRQVRRALRKTRTLELRLDWLRNDAEREALLGWLRRSRGHRRAVFLATCRRREGGGEFRGSPQAELAWLVRAKEAGCRWCDLEIETLRRLPKRILSENAALPKVLLSLHRFDRTPSLSRLTLGRHANAAAIKIAATSRSIRDSVRLLHVTRGSKNVIAVPMGEVGLPARLLALREGSALAYAPVSQSTAPGQVSLEQAIGLYRAHQMTRRTRVYGVIANPVAHSLSPLFHNAGFAARGIDAVYLPFLVENLRDFIDAVPQLGIRGFSVTIPHKQNILRYLAECEPLAEQIGAVNTVVVRRDGKLVGSNTDYLGVLQALQSKLRIHGSRVLLFGAGGAARAAAFALVHAGARVFICARRQSAAKDLARAAGAEAIRRNVLRSSSFDAVVNATPVGMAPRESISPLDPSELNCSIVLDMIARPLETELLRIASRKGILTIPGIRMFFAQGIAQWELWMGRRAPASAMQAAVLRQLRAEDAARKRN